MNVVYTEAYQSYRQKLETIFCSDNLLLDLDGGSTLTGLGEDYQLCSQCYQGKAECGICGSENELLDENGRMFYIWRCIDVDCEFCQLIVHTDGSPYLIFRRDLLATVSLS